MIEIIKELDVEVTKPNIFQAIVAKQYDMNTRFLKVTLKDCGTRIDVPNIKTAKVVINAERKDGQSKGFEGEINEDGTVTVPLHSWMLELDGTVICDISVIDTATDDNKKLTTTSFTLLVEKAAFGGTDITNDPQFDVLVGLLDAADTANEALEKSKEALRLVEDCEEATENANAIREEIEAGGYIESLKEINNGSKFSVWIGTQTEYDDISEKIANCLYISTDGGKTVDELNESISSVGTEVNNLADRVETLEETVETLENNASEGEVIFEGTIPPGETTLYFPNLLRYRVFQVCYGHGGSALCNLIKHNNELFSIQGVGTNSSTAAPFMFLMTVCLDGKYYNLDGTITFNSSASADCSSTQPFPTVQEIGINKIVGIV